MKDCGFVTFCVDLCVCDVMCCVWRTVCVVWRALSCVGVMGEEGGVRRRESGLNPDSTE